MYIGVLQRTLKFFQSALISAILTHFEKKSKVKFYMGRFIIILKMPVDIDMSHFNIIIMLHVDIIYLAYKGQKYATIISNEKKITPISVLVL